MLRLVLRNVVPVQGNLIVVPKTTSNAVHWIHPYVCPSSVTLIDHIQKSATCENRLTDLEEVS